MSIQDMNIVQTIIWCAQLGIIGGAPTLPHPLAHCRNRSSVTRSTVSGGFLRAFQGSFGRVKGVRASFGDLSEDPSFPLERLSEDASFTFDPMIHLEPMTL
jgi:hypothetical protein